MQTQGLSHVFAIAPTLPKAEEQAGTHRFMLYAKHTLSLMTQRQKTMLSALNGSGTENNEEEIYQ
jgi:hypothetical protein